MTDDIKGYYTVKAQNRTFDMARGFIERVYFEFFGKPDAPSPRKTLRKIQIAGTNGKGSTSVMLASILRAAGYSVGLYTSPSLLCVNERIAVDGEIIPDEYLARYKPAIEAAERTLGFDFGGFERITAACYLYFLERDVQFAVMETGLGGRFDTVSAVDGTILTSITSISMDHMNMLGDTIEQIAADKCGIMRPGVPVVVHPQTEAAYKVIRTNAEAVAAPLRYLPSECRINPGAMSAYELSFKVDVGGNVYPVKTALIGEHQFENAANAILCARELNALGLADITDEQIIAGLSAARLNGRLQFVRIPGIKSDVLLDGAHNPGAVAVLTKTLDKLYPSGSRFSAVMCVMADKDISGIVERLESHLSDVACVRITQRAMTPDALADMFKTANSTAVETVTDALIMADEANQRMGGNLPILVAGSLYLAAEVLRLAHD